MNGWTSSAQTAGKLTSNTVHSSDSRYILSLSRCFLRFVKLSCPTVHYQILHQALSVSSFLKIVATAVTVFSPPLPRHTVIWTSCSTDTLFALSGTKMWPEFIKYESYLSISVGKHYDILYVNTKRISSGWYTFYSYCYHLVLWMQLHHFSVFPGDNE